MEHMLFLLLNKLTFKGGNVSYYCIDNRLNVWELGEVIRTAEG